jgi:copper chaperone CopZ
VAPSRTSLKGKESSKMAKTTVLNVPDMTCGHCELTVKEALDGLDGVRSAKADHVTGNVEVSYEEDKVTDEQLLGAVEEAGYTPRS